MRFLEWLSERTSTSSATPPASREAANRIALEHGLRGALLLPPGPPWLFPSDMISTFERAASLTSSFSVEGGRQSPIIPRQSSFDASEKSDPQDERNPGGDQTTKIDHENNNTKNKKRRKALSEAVRNAVWNEWIGIEMGVGPCHCCGRQISQQDYECGHMVAASRGGSDFPENLRPLCRACNRSMRDEHLYEFRRRVGFDVSADPMDVS